MTDRRERAGRYVPALGFRWLTPVYDLAIRATTRERLFKAALLEQAGVQPGHRVLDLACGTGTLAIRLKQRCPKAEVTALDGDPDVLAIASRKAAAAGADVRFHLGLSFGLPYADGTFDRVLSSLFFHHLSWNDKVRTAREAHRVLRPGGELHVADWGSAKGRASRAAFLLVQLLDGFENTRDNVEGRLPEVFERAGFVRVAQSRAFATPLGTMALYRSAKRA